MAPNASSELSWRGTPGIPGGGATLEPAIKAVVAGWISARPAAVTFNPSNGPAPVFIAAGLRLIEVRLIEVGLIEVRLTGVGLTGDAGADASGDKPISDDAVAIERAPAEVPLPVADAGPVDDPVDASRGITASRGAAPASSVGVPGAMGRVPSAP